LKNFDGASIILEPTTGSGETDR